MATKYIVNNVSGQTISKEEKKELLSLLNK